MQKSIADVELKSSLIVTDESIFVYGFPHDVLVIPRVQLWNQPFDQLCVDDDVNVTVFVINHLHYEELKASLIVANESLYRKGFVQQAGINLWHSVALSGFVQMTM